MQLSAVVIAAAGSSAFAQGARVAPRSNVKATTANGSAAGAVNNNNMVIQSSQTGGGVARNTRDFVSGFGGNQVFTPSTTTNTDVRNSDNRRQTEGTRSSGTSVTNTATGTGTTTGTGTNTSTGTNTGSSSGSSASGSSSVNSTGTVTNPDNTQTSSGNTAANTGVNTTATNPLLLNSVIGAAVAGSDAVLDGRMPR